MVAQGASYFARQHPISVAWRMLRHVAYICMQWHDVRMYARGLENVR